MSEARENISAGSASVGREPPARDGWAPPALAVVLAVYLALSALFQWATPPLEASDEAAHVGYVLTLQRGHRLPVPALPGLAMQEALQPPPTTRSGRR
jgi:hypothetical protein